MTELERILLEVELKGIKDLLDFYNWRLQKEGATPQIQDSIDTLLEMYAELMKKLKEKDDEQRN
ncbi:MAG: hypothetical protein U0Y10_06340 [Spirosomataceae bacterium]